MQTTDNLFAQRTYVLDLVNGQDWRFRPDFPAWLADNFHIWTAFEQVADQVYRKQQMRRQTPHYSARTIVEVLRHNSVLHAVNDGEWKINDHRAPDLARVYLMLKPERIGFFELRQNHERAAA